MSSGFWGNIRELGPPVFLNKKACIRCSSLCWSSMRSANVKTRQLGLRFRNLAETKPDQKKIAQFNEGMYIYIHILYYMCIYIYIFLVFLHIFLMSRLETSGVARQRSLDKKASFWDLTMNADVFPIKGKGDFQPAMLDYRRVLPWMFIGMFDITYSITGSDSNWYSWLMLAPFSLNTAAFMVKFPRSQCTALEGKEPFQRTSRLELRV